MPKYKTPPKKAAKQAPAAPPAKGKAPVVKTNAKSKRMTIKVPRGGIGGGFGAI